METANKILAANGFKVLSRNEILDVLPELNKKHMESFEDPKHVTTFNKINPTLNQSIYRVLMSQLGNNTFFLYKINGNSKKSELDNYFLSNDIYVCYIHRKFPGKFVPLIKYIDFKNLKNKSNNINQLEEDSVDSDVIII